MSFEAAEAARRAANAVRVGRIVSVDADSAQAVVDFGGLISPPLDVAQLRAGGLQFWWMPTEGEQVVVLCESGDIAQGIITFGIYAGNAPSSDGGVPMINLGGGKMIVQGDIEVTGDVIASGVSLVKHTHSDVVSGNSSTGKPN
ncbi:phage baseplate assembly protein V [Sulfitobacter sp.]|uniref:phage baseplate assembly protein V n=1 Tax=Sulfitobacter sp. TaxID=1903071 RepID=UPI003001B43F